MGEKGILSAHSEVPSEPTADRFSSAIGEWRLDMTPPVGALFHLFSRRLRVAQGNLDSNTGGLGVVALNPQVYGEVSVGLLEDCETGVSREDGKAMPNVLLGAGSASRAEFGSVIISWAAVAFGTEFVDQLDLGIKNETYNAA